MKRILYIWKGAYPWDIRVQKIGRAISEIGIDVYLLARGENGQPEREFIDGMYVFRVGNELARYKTIPLSINPYWKDAISKAVATFNPNLIIVREIMLASIASDIAGKYGIPIIMDMAENYPAAMREWKKYNDSFLRRFAVHNLKIPDRVEKKAVLKMDGIITVCQEQNERLEDVYKYPIGNIQVVQNTPDIVWFDGARIGSDKPPKVFGHHGYMSAEKSIENLIKAFIIAAKDNETISLQLSGEGECFKDMVKLAEKSDFKERIEFTGKYNYKDLNGILSKIDVGVIPYQISDFNNFTVHNKLFDYFAVGKPVIVSGAKPLARIVEATHAGVVVDCSKPEVLAQEILKFAQRDILTMTRMGLKATVERYNWDFDKMILIEFIKRYL